MCFHFYPMTRTLSNTMPSSCNGDKEMSFERRFFKEKCVEALMDNWEILIHFLLFPFSLSILIASNLIISSVIILLSLWFASLALQSHFSSVFLSYVCCNKLLQTQWLKITQVYPFRVSEVRRLKSSWQQGWIFLRLWERSSSTPLS